MSYASRKYKLTRHDPCLTEEEEAAERAHEKEQQQQQLLHQQQQAEQRQQQQTVEYQQQLVSQALSQLKSQMQSDEATNTAVAAAQTVHADDDDDDMELDAAHSHAANSEKAATPTAVRQELIVLDGANIAWGHGIQLVSSLEGVDIALRWFEHRGFRTVAFLPQSYIRGKYDKHATSAIATAVAAHLQRGSIVLTPAYDSDDAYMISFARQHGGYLVTNDMLRDHVESASSQDQVQQAAILQTPRTVFVLIRRRPTICAQSST
jgi:Zc3h12a-like Ribonuclease NYN domain